MVIVPVESLEPLTLDSLVEEFVTRQGAVHGHHDASAKEMAAAVVRQLRSGEAIIVFDESDESCSIVLRETKNPRSSNVAEGE